MSAQQGCNDDTAVIESFKEALKQRVGQEVFLAWFANGVEFDFHVDADSDAQSQSQQITSGRIVAQVRGQFALDRLSRNYVRELRGAAMQACGRAIEVQLELAAPPTQVCLPIDDLPIDDLGNDPSKQTAPPTRRKRVASAKAKPAGSQSIAALVKESSAKPNRSRRRKPNKLASALTQPTLPNLPQPTENASQKKPVSSQTVDQTSNAQASDDANDKPGSGAKERMTLDTFVAGKCNQLARTAAQLVCENPQAGSPLFISGPPGVGKTHLLFAISHLLRRRHRMRRVMHLSAEKFTNDFCRCVSEGTLTSFRALYRDIDAFIVDDVQFLSAKKATLREMLYTVESLMDRGKTLIFAATHSPNEISGLTQELSGRMSSGLVCTMQTLDTATRQNMLRRYIDEKCLFPWPEETIAEISQTLPGDGRRISGFVNLVGALQRMYQRMPTMAELYEFGGDQLRSDKPFVTLAKIERAVAQTFQLDDDALQSKSQARTATEPRMLAMYLSRELTPAAFAEIGRYYGGRSHSAAILARRRVEDWIASGKPIGRGSASLSARDALDRIESLLRSG
ncbi:MAG: DnaA/Hda family protein [Pirellulaceae bacterium]